MNIPGKVTISRVSHSHQRPDGSFASIRIAIIDEGSGIEFVSAEMSPADFAMAVTGFGRSEAILDIRGLDKVGMLAEHKTVEVEFSRGRYSPTGVTEEMRRALAPHEVDGWKGDVSCFLNHHNCLRGIQDRYIVHFVRYVPRPEVAGE